MAVEEFCCVSAKAFVQNSPTAQLVSRLETEMWSERCQGRSEFLSLKPLNVSAPYNLKCIDRE
jgi:hypothetical protein